MSKPMAFDSGGGESMAVLGQDHGVFLSILEGGIQVSGSARLDEKAMARWLLASLLVVEVFLFAYAYEQGKVLLGLLMLALGAAQFVFFMRNLAGDKPVWAVSVHHCEICGQAFPYDLEQEGVPSTCGNLSCVLAHEPGKSV